MGSEEGHFLLDALGTFYCPDHVGAQALSALRASLYGSQVPTSVMMILCHGRGARRLGSRALHSTQMLFAETARWTESQRQREETGKEREVRERPRAPHEAQPLQQGIKASLSPSGPPSSSPG